MLMLDFLIPSSRLLISLAYFHHLLSICYSLSNFFKLYLPVLLLILSSALANFINLTKFIIFLMLLITFLYVKFYDYFLNLPGSFCYCYPFDLLFIYFPLVFLYKKFKCSYFKFSIC